MATVTMIDNVELDEFGKPKKKTAAPTLPAQDPNNSNATVALSQGAMSGDANWNTTTGNTDVLAKAQKDVLNQPGTSALQDATTQSAMNWVKNPMGDFDPAKTKQAALEKSNVDWANAFESTRQQYGNVSGSGLLQKNMLQNVLQHNVDQRAYESQLDTDNYNRYVDSLGKSIGTAQSVNQGNENIFSQRLGNLGTVRGMAEGERGQITGFQENVALTNLGYDHATQLAAQQNGFDLEKMNLAYGHDMAKMIANQDWQGAESALDREAAALAQSTDINAKNAFADKQNAFDMLKLEKTQDWQSAQNKIQQNFQLALQSNDINATAANIQKQLDLDKWKQENGQKFTAEQNALNRALETSLKTMDVQGQSELMNLKAKLDMGQLVASQDFAGIQAALDRAQQTAMQDKTGVLQKELVKLQGEIDTAKQESQNKFAESQRVATQGWQTGEAIRGEDAAKAAQYFEWQKKELAQKNDLEGQKALATLKNQFDLGIQTQGMAHDEKMLLLKSQYEEAKANKDVDRQKNILSFSYTQDIAKMTIADGFDKAKITMQGDIQKALQAGDFEHAEAMQKALFTQQSTENGKDRVIQEAQVALQAKGINLQEIEQQYGQLEKLVQAGTLDKSVLTDFVGKTLKGANVTMTPPDPLAAQKEADKEFAALQQEYLRTHPEYMNEVGGLKPEGRTAFNEFVNKSMYGEGTSGSEEAISQKANEALNDEQKYNALLNDPTVKEWVPQMGYDSGGFWGTDKRTFANAPSKGSIIKYGGKAYEVLTDPALNTKGNNVEWFNVKDLKEGTVKRVSINPDITGATKSPDFITGL
jgi:hypothetical protein